MLGLAAVYDGPVARDAPLADKTNFRLGGAADWLFTPAREEQVGPLLAFLAGQGLPITVLGEGSNLLVRDGGIRGAVIRVTRSLGDLEFAGEEARCGAGLASARLARQALAAGRGGFVWAAALPGNLGGALRGNAGCFGGDIAAQFRGCRGWRFDGSPFRFGRGELDFGYRWTSLPADCLVTALSLALPADEPAALAAATARFHEILARRAASQPGGLGTAGSTFKNPPGDCAGRLIEACGLKGFRLGGARISERHANFIVTEPGRARAADVEALMQAVADRVAAQTGIALEPEIRIYGER
ncbi:UDP-N-acetylmuramate dehydrogenase [bacterium]|nr:UDP-N-acetylmuramate dehydrogenase [bacterium]